MRERRFKLHHVLLLVLALMLSCTAQGEKKNRGHADTDNYSSYDQGNRESGATNGVSDAISCSYAADAL